MIIHSFVSECRNQQKQLSFGNATALPKLKASHAISNRELFEILKFYAHFAEMVRSSLSALI